VTQFLFVDTGAWVAYFDKSDKGHAVFKNCLSRVVTGTAWRLHTSDYVIDETVTFLRYHTDHTTACTALDRMRELEAAGLLLCHSVDKVLRQRAEDIFRQYKDQEFSFTDCTSFALCQAHQIRHVATVDNDFRIFGFLIVPEDVTP
jgi:predicted nucleic acid-binding protein